MDKKIDFVITWVDGSDEKWLQEKMECEKNFSNKSTDELYEKWNNNRIRFRDWDNLRYWFRGVEKFAPWVNKIHFVTWGHLPSWLNTNNPKLNIVKHIDFIPEEYLPTFNSHTIEWNMNKIPGLAEKFVYFNDDMFIIKNVKEEDFFKNDLPCDMLVSDCVSLDWDVGHAEIRNAQVLNKYFKKRKNVMQNLGKWFNLKYGIKNNYKSFILLPWDRFTGFYEQHITSPYLKRTFDEIWNKEYKIIDDTCKCKFRDDGNVNHWLVKNYQMLTGKFYPRSHKLGKMYMKKIDDDIVNAIIKQKYKILCINDVECSEEEFLEQKNKLNTAFEKILGEKSSFEK